jgi:adenylyl-sulfate kinase
MNGKKVGIVVWLTGLPASGKSTLAVGLEARLRAAGRAVCVLDGDVLRAGVCRDLGYSPKDRAENVRRAAELAREKADEGFVCIVALISPLRAYRAEARRIVGDPRFVEVHVAASLDVCEARDPKNHYKKARAGEMREFTGVSSPYEAPESPELRLDSGAMSREECVGALMNLLENGA